MATNYPGSLDTSTQQPSPSASTEMDDAGFEHDVVHTNHSGAIIALETKVGTGSSSAVADSVLAGTGAGASGWSTAPSLAGLTVDTDTLHVDATNNRVGIGRTNPDTLLHVNGAVTISSDTGVGNTHFPFTDGRFYYTADPETGGTGDHVFRHYSGGSYVEQMRILENGNVGINDSTPSYKLDVNGTARFTDQVYVQSILNVTNDLKVDTDTLFVDVSTDRVGINDSTPSYSLDVAGTGRFTSTLYANGDLYVGKNGGSDSRIYFYDDNSNANRLFMWDDSANRFHLDNNTYINGTGHFQNKVFIQGNGSDLLRLRDTGGTDTGGYISFEQSAGTRMGYIGYGNNDDIHIRNENSGGNVYFGVATRWALQIDTNGNLLPYSDNVHYLGASGRAWNHFYLHQGNTFSSGGYWTLRSRDSDRQVMELVSSERFKKDIVDMPLEEAYQVLDARVIKYRGIDDADDEPLEAGLSAESLHEAGYEYAVRYDEGHWGETPRSIYYEYLTVPLIKICKDQKDRIESLEARVTALEAA